MKVCSGVRGECLERINLTASSLDIMCSDCVLVLLFSLPTFRSSSPCLPLSPGVGDWKGLYSSCVLPSPSLPRLQGLGAAGSDM